MDSVELVKSICKERKIPISKLEKDCGFGNGYIRKLKEGKFPSDRIQVIADYFGVSVKYLMTGENEKFSAESAMLDFRISEDMELKAAIEKYYKLSDEKKKSVLEMVDSLSKED